LGSTSEVETLYGSREVKKNSNSITSAEGDIISCEKIAESTNVTTEVDGKYDPLVYNEVASDRELR
jgi:hypothetical protein